MGAGTAFGESGACPVESSGEGGAGSSITAHCPGVYSTSIPLGLGESDSLTGLEVSA